jgi:hypothetical protein
MKSIHIIQDTQLYIHNYSGSIAQLGGTRNRTRVFLVRSEDDDRCSLSAHLDVNLIESLYGRPLQLTAVTPTTLCQAEREYNQHVRRVWQGKHRQLFLFSEKIINFWNDQNTWPMSKVFVHTSVSFFFFQVTTISSYGSDVERFFAEIKPVLRCLSFVKTDSIINEPYYLVSCCVFGYCIKQ